MSAAGIGEVGAILTGRRTIGDSLSAGFDPLEVDPLGRAGRKRQEEEESKAERDAADAAEKLRLAGEAEEEEAAPGLASGLGEGGAKIIKLGGLDTEKKTRRQFTKNIG